MDYIKKKKNYPNNNHIPSQHYSYPQQCYAGLTVFYKIFLDSPPHSNRMWGNVGQQVRMFMTSSSIYLDQYELIFSQNMVKCVTGV